MLWVKRIRQILVDSDILSELTVNQIFRGKHYNRGIHAARIVREATSLLPPFLNWHMENGKDDDLADVEINAELGNHDELLQV